MKLWVIFAIGFYTFFAGCKGASSLIDLDPQSEIPTPEEEVPPGPGPGEEPEEEDPVEDPEDEEEPEEESPDDPPEDPKVILQDTSVWKAKLKREDAKRIKKKIKLPGFTMDPEPLVTVSLTVKKIKLRLSQRCLLKGNLDLAVTFDEKLVHFSGEYRFRKTTRKKPRGCTEEEFQTGFKGTVNAKRLKPAP